MPPHSREAAYQLRRAERLLADREERARRLRARAVEVAEVLAREFGATRVWLFGSLGRAWFREQSDLDLAVEGVAPARLGAAWDRATEICSDRVDLVALEEADESLVRRIEREGELIHDGRGPRTGESPRADR
jgi:predicted nucleotidyltransferase